MRHTMRWLSLLPDIVLLGSSVVIATVQSRLGNGGWAIACGVLAGVLVVEMLVRIRVRRWNQRMRDGLCPQCGYDLRASPERCPECGDDSQGGSRDELRRWLSVELRRTVVPGAAEQEDRSKR